MTESETVWRGQSAVLKIEDEDEANIPVGMLQDVEIGVDRTIEELRGAGQRKRFDKQQTEIIINVSGTLSAFDEDSWKDLIGYDDTDNQIKDSATPPEFTVDLDVDTTDGDTQVIRATGVVFESVTVSGSPDEWLGLALDGNADDLEFNPA